MDHLSVPRPPILLNDELVFLSPWLEKTFPDFFHRITKLFRELNVMWSLLPYTKDCWCRDFMPIPLNKNWGQYLLYRYYPDYLTKKEKDKCYITDAAKILDEHLKLPYITTDLILDGGNLVKAGDYLIMTEKIFSENPDRTPSSIIEEIERLTDFKVLLLPWDKAEKYGHSDGIVHPIDNHTVLMTNYEDYDKDIAQEIESRLKEHFDVIKLQYDVPHSDPRNWSYINYLDIGYTIIIPALGIPEDKQALKQFKKIYRYKKKIYQIRMEEVIEQGGALNCITWTIDYKRFFAFQKRYKEQHGDFPSLTYY